MWRVVALVAPVGSTAYRFGDLNGAVYIFALEDAVWSQRLYMKGRDGGDNFGIDLAFSAAGNTLAVGASFEDSNATGVDGDSTNNSRSESGAAFLFR
jgi:hypothetical protein